MTWPSHVAKAKSRCDSTRATWKAKKCRWLTLPSCTCRKTWLPASRSKTEIRTNSSSLRPSILATPEWNTNRKTMSTRTRSFTTTDATRWWSSSGVAFTKTSTRSLSNTPSRPSNEHSHSSPKRENLTLTWKFIKMKASLRQARWVRSIFPVLYCNHQRHILKKS